MQLQYFEPITAWLRKEDEAASGFLHGALDFDKLAVAGHSRGGKLAALLYAGEALKAMLACDVLAKDGDLVLAYDTACSHEINTWLVQVQSGQKSRLHSLWIL